MKVWELIGPWTVDFVIGNIVQLNITFKYDVTKLPTLPPKKTYFQFGKSMFWSLMWCYTVMLKEKIIIGLAGELKLPYNSHAFKHLKHCDWQSCIVGLSLVMKVWSSLQLVGHQNHAWPLNIHVVLTYLLYWCLYDIDVVRHLNLHLSECIYCRLNYVSGCPLAFEIWRLPSSLLVTSFSRTCLLHNEMPLQNVWQASVTSTQNH